MAENKKGDGNRFYKDTNIAKYRKWRGVKDSCVDFGYWLKTLGAMGAMVMKSPVRIMKGMFTYRWFGSYTAGIAMFDRLTDGLEGDALKVAHMYLNEILKGTTDKLAIMMKADRRFGDNKNADKIVLFEQVMPPELMHGFPNLKSVPMEIFQGLLGSYMDQNLCPHYDDITEAAGLPADSCRISCNMLGVALSDDFPQIGACLIANNAPCDSSAMTSQLVERTLGIPVITSDIVMRWEDRNTDKYSLSQIKKAIAFIEETTGEKFNEQAFLEGIKKHNLEVEQEMQKWDYMKTPYTAVSGPAGYLFHAFYYSFSGGTLPNFAATDKKVLEICEKAYAEKKNCYPKARHRAISWGGPPGYYVHFGQWLYNCWGVTMLCAMDNFSGNVIIPTDNLDAALIGVARNNEAGVMRRHLTGGYNHLLEFWEEAERFNCDIVIMNDDITCKGALGLTGVIMDQAQTKPQHLVFVSNDMLNHVTIPRQNLRDQINDFMINVMRETPLDESLMVIDDYYGW